MASAGQVRDSAANPAITTATMTRDEGAAPRDACEVTDIRQARARKKRRNVQSPEPSLPSNLQGHIGKHLRAAYDSLVKEPVPNKILDLLKELEAEEKKGSNS